MEKRLQMLGDDTILEITEEKITKTRYSEASLIRQAAYYEETIARAQNELASIEGLLAQINEERSKAK